MSNRLEHIAGRTFHGRRGAAVENAFSYGVDYLLLDPEAPLRAPWLFRRNRAGLVALHDCDHGGPPGQGRGAAWVREVLAAQGLGAADGQILLLAQPRVLGHVFNPVSFWLCHDRQGTLRVVIAEVTNTYGDRHSYLCHHDDLRPIGGDEVLHAAKVFHVSPFQGVEGSYDFRFDIRPGQVVIRIDYRAGERRLLATLSGPRRPATSLGLIGAMLRRPFGSRRVLGLIHWQAFKLWWKGARFHHRPAPPAQDVSR
ncbi:DUF1365 domain-containing protein [Alkalilacustris brevis]|uniref:DUF1365 domain-containing protein n=1 Tax=Alkalilacustris brevis TaxID=2026338 RepID=UPI000E0D4084|nr:DUF1365 domain-containing protein [Alkalilacustris brevis]